MKANAPPAFWSARAALEFPSAAAKKDDAIRVKARSTVKKIPI
jgi:hypothetical protein